MPPPKVKLHKMPGKARPGPPQLPQSISNQSTDPPLTSSNLTTEQEEQFQLELYWCIKQLQAALATDKLSNKQIIEHTRSLNTLMSISAPMIKKRQVMRLSFGDYRTKMLEDERKAKKMSIKVGQSKPSSKSLFFRKAVFNNGENEFKFNFPCNSSMENDDSVCEQEQTITSDSLVPNSVPNNSVTFAKSDNGFRFNFLDNGDS